MSDSIEHKCVICGAPATHYSTQEGLHHDPAGEVVRDATGKPLGRYYCSAHVPHLHVEPLEDRID